MALGAIGGVLREAKVVVLAFSRGVEVVPRFDQLFAHVGLVNHVGEVADRASVQHSGGGPGGAGEGQSAIGARSLLAERIADLIGVAGHTVPPI